MSKPSGKFKAMSLLAAVLAWLVPGAGHVYLGRVARGLVLFLTVSATFWGGIAIGGVMTIDPRNERWWFVAQALTGVHGLIGWQYQQSVQTKLLQQVHAAPEYRARAEAINADVHRARNVRDRRVHLARLAELEQRYLDLYASKAGIALGAPTETAARSYAGVAGLLNLMCIFDAFMLTLMGKTGEPTPEPAEGSTP